MKKLILAVAACTIGFTASAGIDLEGRAWEMTLWNTKIIGCNNESMRCCTVNARVGGDGRIEITIDNHNGNSYRVLAAPGHTPQSAESEIATKLQTSGVEIN